MNTSVPPVTVTTCECDFRTGKSFGWTIFFGFDMSFLNGCCYELNPKILLTSTTALFTRRRAKVYLSPIGNSLPYAG